MSPIVRPVSSKRELAAFLALPRRIYADFADYVAPLDYDRAQLIDPGKSAFWTHGEAAYWLAYDPAGRPVGRISAQVDNLATGPQHEGAGFFGCFDAIDDAEVVAALVATARGYLAGKGKRVMRGPFTLSINAESGLLIEGFTAPPMVLMPWHPPYLRAHLEAAGCHLVKVLHSYAFDRRGSDLGAKLGKLGMERRRKGFSVRPMRMDHLAEDAELGRRLFNGSWAGNWGFVPVSEAEMTAMIKAFRPLLKSEYGVFVEKDGELVGFALFLPNVYEITGDLGGAPSPLGWLRLAWRGLRRPFTGGRAVLFGVASRLVGSVSGASVSLILVDELLRRAGITGVQDLECGWILDDNYAMTSVVEWLGAQSTRRFGVFETSIQPLRAE
ncbi:DNA-binding protein [Labrys miyagiensis]